MEGNLRSLRTSAEECLLLTGPDLYQCVLQRTGFPGALGFPPVSCSPLFSFCPGSSAVFGRLWLKSSQKPCILKKANIFFLKY